MISGGIEFPKDEFINNLRTSAKFDHIIKEVNKLNMYYLHHILVNGSIKPSSTSIMFLSIAKKIPSPNSTLSKLPNPYSKPVTSLLSPSSKSICFLSSFLWLPISPSKQEKGEDIGFSHRMGIPQGSKTSKKRESNLWGCQLKFYTSAR